MTEILFSMRLSEFVSKTGDSFIEWKVIYRTFSLTTPLNVLYK